MFAFRGESASGLLFQRYHRHIRCNQWVRRPAYRGQQRQFKTSRHSVLYQDHDERQKTFLILGSLGNAEDCKQLDIGKNLTLESQRTTHTGTCE